ncbi:AAA family ATPase [bacterium]|nr:AAA family ATPase [bacterium]
MSAEATNSLFEKILVSRAIVTAEELQEAKAYSSEERIPLSRALTALDVLSEDDATALLADACQVRSLKLEDVEIDRESIRHIPAAVAYRHKLIPVRRSGNKLVLAMADPADREAHAAVKAVTDFEIVVFVAKTDGIEHALHIHYGEPPEQYSAETNSRETDFMEGVSVVQDERFAHIGRSIPLNRSYTFETYVEDAGCQYPLNLARTVVSGRPEDRSCPLLLQGPHGCGKTHLLHAIANYLTAKEPLDKYILTTGAAFADSLFDCMRRLRVNLFRYFYRDVKYLLIDDCDALLSKPWAQSELAETIEAIRSREGWVVLCSNTKFTDEQRLTPRLRQLIESGQSAIFEAYTGEGRAAILARQIGQIHIPTEAISRLTSDFKGEIKDLQDLLQQFAAISVLESRDLTDGVVEEMLAIYGVAGSSVTSNKHERAICEAPELDRSRSAAEESLQESEEVSAHSVVTRKVRFICDARSQKVPVAIYVVGSIPELGEWTPNTVQLHDDGTHGDEVAGDGIWTLELEIPAGVEIQYKYTNSGEPGRWEWSEEFALAFREFTAEEGDTVLELRSVFGERD